MISWSPQWISLPLVNDLHLGRFDILGSFTRSSLFLNDMEEVLCHCRRHRLVHHRIADFKSPR